MRLRGASVLLVVIVASLAAAASPERVVAIGDVHGDFSSLLTILREADLVDATNRWVGGGTTFVQTGDYLDRGAHVREVMDLLMRLQEEAPEAGGRVIVLLGNHETMNLLNIFRDVGPGAFDEFADEHSAKRQAQGYRRFQKFYSKIARAAGQTLVFDKSTKEKWMEIHPPGFFEYADAMGPKGVYGRWLRGLHVAAVVDDTLFIHGGYGPLLAGIGVDEINRRTSDEIELFDHLHSEMVADGLILPWHAAMEMKREAEREIAAVEAGGAVLASRDPDRARRASRLEAVLGWEDWWIVHPDGPVWFRGAAFWDQEERGAEMARLLDGLGVRRMVVGHTVQESRDIASRFGGRVFLIDTGMLRGAYDGRPSALEIIGGNVNAIYEHQRQSLVRGRDTAD